jgi:hypothetical protein
MKSDFLPKPKPKKFDLNPHRERIGHLHEQTPGKEIEDACTDLVIDILTNYEGFEHVEKGPDFIGTPFDFFGYKEGQPYIIEFKGSLNTFNTPGETQKNRLQELLRRIDNLKVSLLQVKLKKAQFMGVDILL